MTSPAELRHGAEAHYLDAALYDHTYRSRRLDQRFYVALAERRGGPVLELGVGTGRVALALARAGHDVVGVDRMPTMLARFRERLARESARVRARVRLVRGDLRTYRSDERFALVIAPFNVLNHLYPARDWARAFEVARVHLRRGGRFAFDVRNPDLRALVRDPSHFYRSRPIRDPRTGVRYAYSEAFEYDALTQIEMITCVYAEIGRPENVHVRPLAHRHVFPRELVLMLESARLRVESHCGDFYGGVLAVDCESQVVIARAGR